MNTPYFYLKWELAILHKLNDRNFILFNNAFKYSYYEKLSEVPFHPINDNINSTSLLLVEDAVNYKLYKYILNLINKNMKKNTIIYFKLLHIINTTVGTYFIKNICYLSYKITKSTAKITCSYPLYDYLNNLSTDIVFGMNITEYELKEILDIYKDIIINSIDEIFADHIEIPSNSDKSPRFYMQMIIYLKILNKSNSRIKPYKNIINNLNIFIDVYQISEEEQKLDKEIYENEMKIRKESEPNWLFLKDNEMQGKQLVTTNFSVENSDIEVIKNSSDEETATNNIISLINLIRNSKEIAKYKDDINKVLDLNKKLLDSKNKLMRQQNNENIRYEQLLQNLYSWQNFVLNIINKQGICLWFNDETEKYYFRDGVSGKLRDGNTKKISKKITNALDKTIHNYINQSSYQNIDLAIEIRIIESIDEIFKTIEKYKDKRVLVIPILSNRITTINDEVFDIGIYNEFYRHLNTNNLIRNLFIYTPYLQKRTPSSNYKYIMHFKRWNDYYEYIINQNGMLELITSNNKQANVNITFRTPLFENSLVENSFIEKFIFTMVNEDQSAYNYIINWLANYFQTLEKSSVALVLTGAKDITEEIFIDKVIKAIFGRRYCVTINDEEFKTSNVGEIAKDTLFYHITDISKKKTNFDDKTLDKLIRQLLINSMTEIKMKDKTYQEVQILGQTIITSDNPYSYIKNNESKCTIVQVSSLEEVRRKLDLDMATIEENIKNDLNNFSDILAQYPVHKSFINYALKTSHLKKVKENNEQIRIEKEQTSQRIDDFIQALKEQNINYFLKVKEDDDDTLYKNLENALLKDDGYYIVQYLSKYYNIIYDESFQQDDFIKILKDKDDIFKQQIDTLDMINKSGEKINLFKGVSTIEFTTSKKLGKIKGYTLPKDLSVQKGVILKQVSKINRFEYSYEDIEDAKNLYEYFDKQKKKKKKK